MYRHFARTFARICMALIFTFAALFLIAARPLQDAPPDFTNLTAVLTWLAGVGGPYFVGRVLSLLAENWAAWHRLPTPVKFIAPLVASAVIAVLATLALQQASLIEVAAPWYTIVAGAILGYFGTQQQLIDAKKARYGAQYR